MKTIKTTVYLNAADYRRLKSLAEEQDRSAAELVREAVSAYAARARQRTRPRCIGIADSGDPHFAERSEELLDDFGEEDIEGHYPAAGSPHGALPAKAERGGTSE